MALRKKIRPSILEWDTKRLQAWIVKIGFESCQKLLMYQGVDGAQLSTANYEYMSQYLGIEDENQCDILLKAIDKVKARCVEDC